MGGEPIELVLTIRGDVLPVEMIRVVYKGLVVYLRPRGLLCLFCRGYIGEALVARLRCILWLRKLFFPEEHEEASTVKQVSMYCIE